MTETIVGYDVFQKENNSKSIIFMSDCCACSVPTLFSSVVSEGVQQAACAEAEWLQLPSGGP